MPESCDFRMLKYEKEDILRRIQKEVSAIDDMKEKILRTGDVGLVVGMMDKAKGIDIMSQRLVADFGMTYGQIKETMPSRKFSLADKARLAMAIREWGRERGTL